MVMEIWSIQFTVVFMALVVFYHGLDTERLARMPGKPLHFGIMWEHAWGIVLLLIPISTTWYVLLITIPFWAFGIWCYVDDYYQHWRITWDQTYKSPLHLWGWYVLKPWLAKYVWKGFHDA